jgi:monoterpene epsilon-lactone hydrolase
MSLRAELVRLGLRWFLKWPSRRTTVEGTRRFLAAVDPLIPAPPTSATTQSVDAGGARADRIVMPWSDRGRHVLYLHGGAYVVGSPSCYRHFTWRIAAASRACALVLDYRLAPEHPFPAALDDAVAAYRWLIADGAEPRRVAIVGDSAGGGLALALLLRLRDEGLALPGAAVALSPWTDLALTGASLARNAKADPMIDAAQVPALAQLYLAGAEPRNPHASPLYGDPTGLPPTLIQVGSDEVLHDDAVRIADKMRAAGCHIELDIWPRMPHVWHAFAPLVPEAERAIVRIGAFVAHHTA